MVTALHVAVPHIIVSVAPEPAIAVLPALPPPALESVPGFEEPPPHAEARPTDTTLTTQAKRRVRQNMGREYFTLAC